MERSDRNGWTLGFLIKGLKRPRTNVGGGAEKLISEKKMEIRLSVIGAYPPKKTYEKTQLIGNQPTRHQGH